MRRLLIPLALMALVLGCTASRESGGEEGLLPIPRPDESQFSAEQKEFYDAALSDLKRHDPQTAPLETSAAHGELGKRFLADGFADAAEACFRNAVDLDPERYDWIYYLAHVDRGNGNAEEAIAGFERALELRPDDVAARVWLGNTLFQDASHERARAAFEKAIELHAEAASAHLGLGRVALAEGRHDEAVTALTRVLELSPGSTIAHYPLAQAYRALGKLELAQQHLDQRGETEAYPYDPLMDEIRNRFGNTSVLIERGGNAFAQGNFTRAVEEFRLAVEASPGVAMGHANLGSALFRLGDRAAARAAFERALELDPSDPAVLYSLGVISYHEGNAKAEERYYEQTLDSQPDYILAHVGLAHALRERGAYGPAIEHYRAALELEPRRAVAHLGLVMALVKLERWSDARDALLVAIEALPDQPAFVHALARIHAAAPDETVRDGQRALGLLEQLIQAGQQNTDVGETLAMAMAAVGEFEQAIRFQTQVIEVARNAGQSQLLDTMNARLQAYRASRAWLAPWPDDDPLHRRPDEAFPAPPRRSGFPS